MNQKDLDKNNLAAYKLVGDLFNITALYNSGNETVLTLSPIYNIDISTKLLKDRLQLAGYKYTISNDNDLIILRVNSKPTFKIPPLNIILFFTTLISIYVVPVFLQIEFTASASTTFADIINQTYQALLSGQNILFTVAMISILFVHEMGHYIASRRRHIITSWPYFIPAPNIIGTFGAIIKSKSPFWNRRDLIEVGAWGPIAGWIVALGWTVYGIATASVEPLTNQMANGFLGEPLIFKFISTYLLQIDSNNYTLMLNEAMFAGWVGMLVTALNMLPIGQLDGGHVVYGLLQKRQHIIGYAAMGGLFILGFYSPIWWIFALMGVVFGVKHPRTLNDSEKLSKTAILLGIGSLIILILSFTPTPFP